jgi:hypothetical protein
MITEVEPMSRRFLLLLLMSTVLTGALFGSATGETTFGFHALFGGRYDDMRMCVGSPPGVKGGPIGEVYLDIGFPAGDSASIVLNIPVFRPILFGAAFRMLQFEPQFTYERLIGPIDGGQWVLGAGLGAVFHYGPDYLSDPENRGEDFFAFGPLVSASAGLRFDTDRGAWMPGVKAFYAPIFSGDYGSGTVAGGGLEIHYSP